MDDTNTYRLAASYRLELILLGFALAANGDRERIFQELDRSAVNSEHVASILGAVEYRDGKQVRALVGRFGIEPKDGETVLSSIIRKIEETANQRRLKVTLAEMIASGTLDDYTSIETQLATAMETMKRLKEKQNVTTS